MAAREGGGMGKRLESARRGEEEQETKDKD